MRTAARYQPVAFSGTETYVRPPSEHTCLECGLVETWLPSRMNPSRESAPDLCRDCRQRAHDHAPQKNKAPMPINLPIADPHWYRHPDRACLGAKAEEFYELSEGETARARLYAATVIEENCNRCPVLTDCLADALNREDGLGAPYRYGIQGGLTPQQRAVRARALLKPINHGTTGGYKAHKRRKEQPCEPCAAARRAYEVQLRAGKAS